MGPVEMAEIKVKEVLFDGLKVKLETGEEIWIQRSRIEDFLPHRLVVPAWYKKRLLEKLEEREKEE